MTTIHRVRTEWADRYHVQLDADASALDCFTVELPPYTTGHGLLVRPQPGNSMDDLWREALTTLAWLRQQPCNPVHPAHVFQPFGVITARNAEDLRREHEINREMMLGECTERDRERLERTSVDTSRVFHERRVEHLCRALDLLNGVPLPVVISFPVLKERH